MQISDISTASHPSSSNPSGGPGMSGLSKDFVAESTIANPSANPQLPKLLISSSAISPAESCLPSPLYASATGEMDISGPKLDSSGSSTLAGEVSLPLSPTSPVGGGSIDVVSTSNAAMDEDTMTASANPFSPEPKKKSSPASQTSSAVRKCAYCGATSTPMWRHGPGDFTNLCNSCGVKWRRGKILSTGDNRHHLCKTGSSSSKKQMSTLNKESSPAAISSSATVSANTGEKRKAIFDQWGDDAEWDLPRTRKARSCARKLWSGRSLGSSEAEDGLASTAVETATKAVEIENTLKSSQPKVFVKSSFQENSSSKENSSSMSPLAKSNHFVSHQLSSSNQLRKNHKSSSISYPVSSNVSSSSLAVSTLNSSTASSQLLSLTAEFAHLLGLLKGDPAKTNLFSSLLIQDFKEGMRKAYESGSEVEMSVLDIRPETWDLLRALAL